MKIKRSRPLLGTTLTIHSEKEVEASLITEAFQEAEKWQKVFSFRDPDSVLSQFQRMQLKNPPLEFLELVEAAKNLQQISKDTFFPYQDSLLDLSGIAKGAIVDRVAEFLLRQDPHFQGSINAGGDLRFLGKVEKITHVRVGHPDSPLLRPLTLQKSSFTSSSLGVSITDSNSSTLYPLPLAEDLTPFSTACVSADQCWIADGLTKVALFANSAIRKAVAQEMKATLVIFDEKGEIFEHWGPP